MNELTQEYVRELFDYKDGNLYWKVKKATNTKIGDLAGNDTGHGYRQIGIDGKQYYTHRLIFLFHHGCLPQFLDHIDGDSSNNNISNLREATYQENGRNCKKTKSINGEPTSSRFKGVTWHKQVKKWVAQIMIDGEHKYLGLHTSEIEAAKAYNRAAIELFGRFAKLNIIDY